MGGGNGCDGPDPVAADWKIAKSCLVPSKATDLKDVHGKWMKLYVEEGPVSNRRWYKMCKIV